MRHLVLCVCLVLVACSSPTAGGPEPPASAVPLDPPERFAGYYADMERCSATEGDFSRVRWFVVPDVGDWPSTVNGKEVVGEWWPPHSIYIAEFRLGHGSEEKVVTHEILHELLQDRTHPEPPFGRCAPLEV